MHRQFCVECPIRVEAIATGGVGTRVHGRSDTKGLVSVTRAQGRNSKIGSQSGYHAERQSQRVVNDLAKKLKTE